MSAGRRLYEKVFSFGCANGHKIPIITLIQRFMWKAVGFSGKSHFEKIQQILISCQISQNLSVEALLASHFDNFKQPNIYGLYKQPRYFKKAINLTKKSFSTINKSTMLNANPARGTKDILPEEMLIRNYILSKILPVYESFGFTQIATPAIENIQQLNGGQGGDNEKMVFQILKRGEKLDLNNIKNISDLVDLGLRFDLTVPLARFYANNQTVLPQPFKAIQVDNVWRAERPQKGRFRQFTQCDIDILGQENELAEIELILATTQALSQIGFDNLTVRINDRRFLNELAKDCGFEEDQTNNFFIIFDKLDKIGLVGVENELKGEGFADLVVNKFLKKAELILNDGVNLKNLPEILPNLDEKVLEKMQNIFSSTLDLLPKGINLKLDLSLVRGMGYYTGAIFEIASPDFGSSVAGGGRYDKMIGRMLKQDVPACGFSIGFERIVEIFLEKGFIPPSAGQKMVVLYNKEDFNLTELTQKVSIIRSSGKIVLVNEKAKNVKKQLDDLQTMGYQSFAIFKPNEELLFKNFQAK